VALQPRQNTSWHERHVSVGSAAKHNEHTARAPPSASEVLDIIAATPEKSGFTDDTDAPPP
jgi:hypothetical protein